MTREGLTIPRFYIRYLTELEDYLNGLWEDKDGRASMSKPNQKSLNSLRQKVRKYNRDFENEIAAYREGPDPVGYTSDEGTSEEEAENKDTAAIADVKKKLPAAVVDSDVSSDEDEWADSSDSDSSVSDIDFEGKEMEELRRYFLKSTVKDNKTKDKKKDRKVRPQVEVVEGESDGGEWNVVAVGSEKPLFPSKTEITLEIFLKKFSEINTGRGKKSTNTKMYLKYLEELYEIAKEVSE